MRRFTHCYLKAKLLVERRLKLGATPAQVVPPSTVRTVNRDVPQVASLCPDDHAVSGEQSGRPESSTHFWTSALGTAFGLLRFPIVLL